MTVRATLAVDGDRLIANLNQLATIGALPNGGVRRLAFTPEDLQGRAQVQRWMLDAGMSTRIDAAGNLIGQLPGQQDVPALATGSHIDTVPAGGCYDGALGVLAGIEVARTLTQNGMALKHPYEVIVFSDEEDTMIGGRAMAGTASLDVMDYCRKDGRPIDEAIAAVGGDWDQIAKARRTCDDICAFVELHVEQGGLMEQAGADIGVVEGIVGMQRYQIAIEGQANHAGTTPMDQRQDALVAAAQIVLAVNQLATIPPSHKVATVGALRVSPNAANIVPGQVIASLDVRDLDQSEIDGLVESLNHRMTDIAQATRTKIVMTPQLNVAPSPAAPSIQAAIADAAEALRLNYIYLPSRAGHDALEMGRITDMGMIFVPSIGGISHSETEYTNPQQCVAGANVLLRTLLDLDRQYP